MTIANSGNNFSVIKSFVSKEKATHLATLLSSYVDEIKPPGDELCECPSIYGFVPFVQLLCDKNAEVGEALGDPVLPSYCYSRIYGKNSSLRRHIDRPSCEVSLTVHLDGDEMWPIWLGGGENKKIPIILEKGDALLYLGNKIEHWRDPYPGHYYSQVFLHYVRTGGEFRKHVFDRLRHRD
jgi:hypothetical protein